MKKQGRSDWALPSWTPGHYLQRFLGGALDAPENKLFGLQTNVAPPASWRTYLLELAKNKPDLAAQIEDMAPTDLYNFIGETADKDYDFPAGGNIEDAVARSRAESQVAEVARNRFWGQMLNLAAGGALVGGGTALAQAIPEWLRVKKQLPDAPEEKNSSIKESKEVLDPTKYMAKGRPFNFLEVDKLTPEMTMFAPIGELPGGLPLGLAVGGGLIGGGWLTHNLVHNFIDSLRNKELTERKKKLKEEFEHLMAGEKYASLNETIDMAHDTMEKEAWGTGLTAIATLVGLLELIGGTAAGAALAKKTDPNRLRRKAVEYGLKLKDYEDVPRLTLPKEEEEVVEPEVLDALPEAALPAALEAAESETQDTLSESTLPAGLLDEYDEALDLKKAGVFGAPTPYAKPNRFMADSTERNLGFIRPNLSPAQRTADMGAGVVNNVSEALKPIRDTIDTARQGWNMYQDFREGEIPPELQERARTMLEDVSEDDKMEFARSLVQGTQFAPLFEHPEQLPELMNAVENLDSETLQDLTDLAGGINIDELGSMLEALQNDELPEGIDIGEMISSMSSEDQQALVQQFVGNVDMNELLADSDINVSQLLENVDIGDVAGQLMQDEDVKKQIRDALWSGISGFFGRIGDAFMNPQQGYAQMGPGLTQYLGGRGEGIVQGLMQLLSQVSGAVPGIFGGTQAPPQTGSPTQAV